MSALAVAGVNSKASAFSSPVSMAFQPIEIQPAPVFPQ